MGNTVYNTHSIETPIVQKATLCCKRVAVVAIMLILYSYPMATVPATVLTNAVAVIYHLTSIFSLCP